MKNIRIFFPAFGVEIFYMFEKACFLNGIFSVNLTFSFGISTSVVFLLTAPQGGFSVVVLLCLCICSFICGICFVIIRHENTPIHMCRKFHFQKLKIFREKL